MLVKRRQNYQSFLGRFLFIIPFRVKILHIVRKANIIVYPKHLFLFHSAQSKLDDRHRLLGLKFAIFSPANILTKTSKNGQQSPFFQFSVLKDFSYSKPLGATPTSWKHSKTLGATPTSWEQLQNPGNTPKPWEQFQNPESSHPSHLHLPFLLIFRLF